MSKVENLTQNNNQIDFSATGLTEMHPSGTIEYFSKDGNIVTRVLVNEVLVFIEKHSLNINNEHSGNTGIGEPWNDIEQDVIVDPMEYLDTNFNMVCQLYITQLSEEDPAISIINKKIELLEKEDIQAIKDGDLDKSIRLSSIKVALMDVRSDLSKVLNRRAA